MKCEKFLVNAAGRRVPTIVNGESVIPYQGLRKHRPVGRNMHPRLPLVLTIPMTEQSCIILSRSIKTLRIKGWNDDFDASSSSDGD
jgi:hypothetical protein